MTTVSMQVLGGQLLLGLINGAFYALLSLGLAIIFGLLRVINFAHGAQYMLGAFTAYLLARHFQLGYWWALVLAPPVVALTAMLVERTMLSRLYKVDHLYGLLLTFGVALVVEGLFRYYFGSSGKPYPSPALLRGATDLGFMILPNYRGWVVVASLVLSLSVWLLIEHTKLGSYLRAATENPTLVTVFGINVPLLMTVTYGLGAGLAGIAGVLAAPIYQVSPLMGTEIIIIVFAVVVVGGMGSILGAVVTGFGLGIIEAFVKMLYPEASAIVIFVIMAVVLAVRPAGLFGQDTAPPQSQSTPPPDGAALIARHHLWALAAAGSAALIVAPLFVYPVFLMKIMCFALFAAAFNLLLGYVGLLSFGHAAFFGSAAYITAHTVKVWGVDPILGILLGVAFAALLGAIVAGLAIRRHGIYFSMITLSLAQLVYFICLRAPFTHGEDGIQNVPRGLAFGILDLSDSSTLYVFVSIITAAGFFFVYRIINSPFGNVLKAIRENEGRATSLGYDIARYKLAVFVMSAALAGLAGSTKALVFQIATLTDVGWRMSGEVVLMSLLGGIGTMLGPFVGATIIVTLETWLATSMFPVTVLTGAIFIVCVLAFRRGLVGELLHYLAVRKEGTASTRTQDAAEHPDKGSVRPAHAR